MPPTANTNVIFAKTAPNTNIPKSGSNKQQSPVKQQSSVKQPVMAPRTVPRYVTKPCWTCNKR